MTNVIDIWYHIPIDLSGKSVVNRLTFTGGVFFFSLSSLSFRNNPGCRMKGSRGYSCVSVVAFCLFLIYTMDKAKRYFLFEYEVEGSGCYGSEEQH